MAQADAGIVMGSANLLKLGRNLVQKLSVCLRTSRLYDSANVTVQEAARDVVETIRTIHRMEGNVQLAIVLDYLTLNDVRLKSDLAGHSTFKFLLDGFRERGLGAVHMSLDTGPSDLVRFCAEYHRLRIGEGEDPFGELEEGLKRAGVKAIQLEELVEISERDIDVELKRDIKQKSIKTFFKAISLSRQILMSSDPKKMNFKKAKRVVHRMVDIITQDDSFLLSMTSIKNYDEYVFNHSANVSVYSITFGQKLGLERQALADLGLAGLFHDLGKTRVPKEILNKPAKLKADEWEIMKRHSVYGAELLLQARDLTDSTIRHILVAFEHHLNLDLGGYPRLTDRRDLNLFSKIVAICDVFDALTTPRSYRSACYSPKEALSIMMEGRGTLFDPTLLKIFVNSIGIFPIGTLVELDNGEMGVVIRTSDEPGEIHSPYVRVFADSRGNRVEERVVDTSKKDEGGKPLRTVSRTVDPADYFDSIEEYLEIL